MSRARAREATILQRRGNSRRVYFFTFFIQTTTTSNHRQLAKYHHVRFSHAADDSDVCVKIDDLIDTLV